jgi:hypothetical protein
MNYHDAQTIRLRRRIADLEAENERLREALEGSQTVLKVAQVTISRLQEVVIPLGQECVKQKPINYAALRGEEGK